VDTIFLSKSCLSCSFIRRVDKRSASTMGTDIGGCARLSTLRVSDDFIGIKPMFGAWCVHKPFASLRLCGEKHLSFSDENL
ncbi:MAG: hypothetical protein ACNA75_10850, partial [Thiohalomonadaceae bacterium]